MIPHLLCMSFMKGLVASSSMFPVGMFVVGNVNGNEMRPLWYQVNLNICH